MSYPFSLDLAFGSELATADPISHISVKPSVSPSPSPDPDPEPTVLPTTLDELATMKTEGKAIGSLPVTEGVVDTSGVGASILASFPDNLAGVVTDDGEHNPVSLEYSSSGSGTDFVITIIGSTESNVALILDQAVD